MTFLSILILLLVILLLLTLTICYLLLRKSARPKFYSIQQTIEIESSKGFLKGYDALPQEDYLVTSFDGYELHCISIPYPGSRKVAIITHGHTYTHWGSIKYLMMFHKLGYNAVLYDDRGHGLNKKAPITMGYRESRDLMAVIADTQKRFGPDCYIGLHGESMGSAISLQALAFHPPIHFIVSDCGYSDLRFFTKMYIRTHFHLPAFLIDLASPLCKLLYGYYLSQVSPISNLPKNQIPICFIHGAADTFIDPCNAKRMYDTDGGYKELHLFEGAAHACSYESDPDRYLQILTSFLHKVESEDGLNEYKYAE